MLKLNRLSAAVGASFVMGMLSSGQAFATTGSTANASFNGIASNITTGIASLPGFLTAICYIMGLIFAALGVLKIKDHVENPGQTALKDGTVRLAVGGALFVLPMITSAMQGLIDSNSQAAIKGRTLNKIEMNTN